MQDLEFTIQDGKLWMLQTRNGKRTGTAMSKWPRHAGTGHDRRENRITSFEAAKLDELLHPVFDKEVPIKSKSIDKRSARADFRAPLADVSYSLLMKLKSES